MKILLVRPRNKGLFFRFNPILTEPLELEYLAKVIVEEKHDYKIYDGLVENHSFNTILKNYSPDIVALTGYYTAKDNILKYSQKIKKFDPGIIVVVGGVHAEINEKDFYSTSIDIIVTSGGHETFRQLIINNFGNYDEIAGISFLEKGKWIKNALSELNIDNMIQPDRSHFHKNQDKFQYLYYGSCALVKTSYGCPYNCNFCYCTLLNQGNYNCRKNEEIIKELQNIKNDLIWIVDDTFLVDKGRVENFVEEIKENNITKRFIIYSRADFIIENPRLIKQLANIGVVNIIVGFESIDNDKLQDYDKNIKADLNNQCIKILKENNIECVGLFIVDIDVKIGDFKNLKQWLVESELDIYTLSIFTPFPGTNSYEKFEKNLITKDCTKWDLLHLVLKPKNLKVWRFYWEICKIYLGLILRNNKLLSWYLFKKPSE